MTKAVGLPQTSTRPKKRAKNRRLVLLRKERNQMQLRIKFSATSAKNTENKAKEVQMKHNTYVVVRKNTFFMMKQILQELSYT